WELGCEVSEDTSAEASEHVHGVFEASAVRVPDEGEGGCRDPADGPIERSHVELLELLDQRGKRGRIGRRSVVRRAPRCAVEQVGAGVLDALENLGIEAVAAA